MRHEWFTRVLKFLGSLLEPHRREHALDGDGSCVHCHERQASGRCAMRVAGDW
jgi:hypothetical protein